MDSITNGVGDSSPISRSVDLGLGCQINVEISMLSDSSVFSDDKGGNRKSDEVRTTASVIVYLIWPIEELDIRSMSL